jgi:hypothetical protein
LDDTSIDLSSLKDSINLLCGLCILESGLESSLEVSDGDLGLTTSS